MTLLALSRTLWQN